jgi:ATP-binding cassette subfamily B protein RaxB
MRDGVTAAWLIACARHQGLHAEGFEVSVDQLAALPTPAILHTASSHFVVFEGLDRGRAVIVDPSTGARSYLDADGARELLTGTALAFEPATAFQPRSRVRLKLQTLSPVLALPPQTTTLVGTVGIALTVGTVALGTERLWSSLLSYPHPFPPTLVVLERMAVFAIVLALSVMILLSIVDAAFRSQVSTRLAQLASPLHAEEQLSARPSKPVSYFDDIDPFRTPAFPQVSWILLTLSILVGAALSSWSNDGSVPILLAAFSLALATSLIAARLIGRQGPRPQHRRALTVYVVRCAHVLISVAIWLIAFHLDGRLAARNDGLPFPHGLHVVVPQLLLAVATSSIGGTITRGQRWLEKYERLFEALPDKSSRVARDVPSAPRPALVAAAPLPHAPLLRIQGITFRLGDERDRLLSKLEFDVHEGEHIAIVGPVGAGKTTLIRAILGRLDVAPGTILYCGRARSEYGQSERDWLVRGIVQGDRVPDSTISRILGADNLDTPRGDPRAICARLGFDEHFSRLPLGYNTPVSFNGDTLSRGQRQMLLLASAAASGARVLALDDPVNSLDDATARRVLAALTTLPSAVVLTMASEAALSELDFRVVRLDDVFSEKREELSQIETLGGALL